MEINLQYLLSLHRLHTHVHAVFHGWFDGASLNCIALKRMNHKCRTHEVSLQCVIEDENQDLLEINYSLLLKYLVN